MWAMSDVELLRVPALAAAPYAYGSIVRADRLLFTAGACPLDEHGQVVEVGDVAAQARRVMANLTTALQAAGAELSDVVRTTVYVATANRHDLSTAWEVVHAAFGDHDVPSTLLGVAVLGYTDQLVEVEAIAVLPS
jgi:enamine deaminase RidA (YjgF/YER057c/UK114 family)